MMTFMTFASDVASNLFFLTCTNLGDTLSHIRHVSTRNRRRNKVDQNNNNNCLVHYNRWDELPDDLMEIILQHQTDIIDRLSMRLVCTSWESIFKHRKNEFRIPPPQSAWLLLPSDPLWCKKVSFYDMSHARLYNFQVPTWIRWIQGSVCCGSSKGWLVMLTEDEEPMKSQIFLFNPISGSTHKLPSLKSVVDHYSSSSQVNDFVSNIQLSCEDPANCIVASYIESDPKIAFCRVGSQNWDIYDDFVEYHKLRQVLFSTDGKVLYALKSVYESEPMNVTTHCSKSINYNLTLKIVPMSYTSPLFNEYCNGERLDEHTLIIRSLSSPHLVESNSGEILLIRRVMDGFLSKDVIIEEEEEAIIEEEDNNIPFLNYVYLKEFEIYMLDADMGTSNMTKLTSLENQILFFSSSGLSLVEARNFTELQGNCIYFMEDNINSEKNSIFPYVSRESGIYHIADGRIDRCFPSIPLPVLSHMGWFNPNLF